MTVSLPLIRGSCILACFSILPLFGQQITQAHEDPAPKTTHLSGTSTPNTAPVQAASKSDSAIADSLSNDTTAGLSATTAFLSDSTVDSPSAPHASLAGDSALPQSAAVRAASDDSVRLYDSPYFSFGTGWMLGSMPLFDAWMDGLPDSIGDMPGFETLGQPLTAEVSEQQPPDAYNTAFPLSIAFTPLVNKQSHVSVTASLWWMSKKYLAFWQNDSLGTIWHIEHELSIIAGSMGFRYLYRIPSQYFSIANIDRAFLVAGLDGAPYVKITDSKDEFSDAAEFNTSSRVRYRGYSFNWQAGITTFRPLTERAGIEIGACYTGHWFGRFIRHDHHVRWSAINDDSSRSDDVLSFMAHRFKIYFNILIGRKPNKSAESATTPSPRPSDSTTIEEP